MYLTSENRDTLPVEVAAAGFELSVSQKKRMRRAFTEACDSLAEFLKANPNISNGEIIRELSFRRDRLRQQLASLMTPEQSKLWIPDLTAVEQFLDDQEQSLFA
jgi:hypothetical protein